MSIITLTTDFGGADYYVAAMKGVILSINPRATIVDITHQIPPQDVMAGAFTLANAAPYFPPGTVHVAVVDPGVGSERRPIALRYSPFPGGIDPPGAIGHHFFVGPDNGVLTMHSGLWFGGSGLMQRPPFGPPTEWLAASAVHLTNRKFWRGDVSHTFHGRDIFAPVAAHLSRSETGDAFDELGEALSAPAVQLNIPAVSEQGSALLGSIIHIDHFGNCVSNVLEWRVADRRNAARIQIGGRTLLGVRRTYAEVARGEMLALIGSSGYLEIAVREGSAATVLGISIGTPFRIDY